MNTRLEHVMESIRQLPPPEREQVRLWLEGENVSDDSPEHEGQANKSLQWLDSNRAKYSGQWVALDGDRLIASGPTARAVYDEAKAAGVKIPFVSHVVEEESTPFTGGWIS